MTTMQYFLMKLSPKTFFRYCMVLISSWVNLEPNLRTMTRAWYPAGLDTIASLMAFMKSFSPSFSVPLVSPTPGVSTTRNFRPSSNTVSSFWLFIVTDSIVATEEKAFRSRIAFPVLLFPAPVLPSNIMSRSDADI
ncbi:hypothetical protein EGW08_020652 [Elysia chlorotica]|uniref:Uncharacterized protein n=1 Tax=Elysia chlorotica TaxID=188477 RepID=A0A3S0ZNJ4_ELYCH|nr:hypothetical protein EGW08_020652 [Elysia chlorotica]